MKRSRFLLLCLLVVTVIISGCEIQRAETPIAGVGDTPAPPPGVTPTVSGESLLDDSARVLVTKPTTAFIPGEVLIKFTQEAMSELPDKAKSAPQALSIGSASLDPVFAELGITGLEPLLARVAQATGETFESLSSKLGKASQFYVASFDPGKNIEQVVEAMKDNVKVEYAEPNFVAFASAEPVAAPFRLVPNDPFYSYQWNMEAIQMPRAWEVSTGAGVIVAVLDTGVAYETIDTFVQASDLAGTNFVTGYDFINNDDHPNDDNGHGTHVAGTIAQTTNNGEGVAGVAYNASIMPVKVLDSMGQGSYAGIIQGINFAVENEAKVINLSLSGHSGSQALQEAIDQARAKGVVVVVAAGNNGGSVEYPAHYDSALAVGAVRFDKTRAPYSNFGSQIDLVAPGGDNQIDQNNDGFGDGIVQQTFKPGEINQFRYRFLEGTSMATPHVSGLIALLLAKDPNLSPDQVENVLKTSALDLGPAGADNEYGAGLIQACGALAAIGSPCEVEEPPTPTPTVEEPTTPTPGETPTSTPTPVTPTTTPVGDIIDNGGFENDDGWVFKWTPRRGRYSTDRAHSGSRSALVGIVDSNADRFSYSSVAQKVTIPADTRKATLTAYVYPISQDIPSGDAQLIMVLNQDFRVIKTLHRTLSNAQTWQEHTFDLSQYAGRTIYIYFGAVNVARNGKTTALYVDDVSLVIEK